MSGGQDESGTTIALLSPCGYGNLGDAAIQTAMIQNVRRRKPSARIVAFTLNPQDTANRHGITAYPARRMPWLGAAARRPAQPASGAGLRQPAAATSLTSDSDSSPDRHSGSRASARGMKGLLKRLLPTRVQSAVRRVLRPIRRGAREIVHEVRHIRDLRHWMSDVNVLVISGGGQLDEEWGGPWRHPYGLWKLTCMARLSGARVLALSLGVGSLSSPVSRWFIRRTLKRCEYRSARDRRAAEVANTLVGRRDTAVVPDIAYSVLMPTWGEDSGTGRIALSPMAWADPRRWPFKDEDLYRGYVSRSAALVDALLSGCEDSLWLVPTNTAMDGGAVEDIQGELARLWDPGADPNARVVKAQPETVEGLLALLRSMTFVVASRMHAVLLSTVVGVPVIALSYDPKVTDLMADLGLGRYCRDIRDFDPLEVADLCLRIHENPDPVRQGILEASRRYREKLERQYDQVFSLFGEHSPTAPSAS